MGLLLGPGYYYFCERLSGEPAETHVLTERAERWELPDGAILRVRSGLAFKPLAFDLAPDKSRYRLRLAFQVERADAIPSGASNSYQLSLMQGDLTVLERSLEVAGSGKQARTLQPFEIFLPGAYVLLLEEIGAPALRVSAVEVELINGVEVAKMWLVWCGVVMLGFGMMLALREAIQGALRR